MDRARALREIDHEIRRGAIDSAARKLLRLCARPPEALRVELAELCYRAGLADTGLRLLAPRVRPGRKAVTASERESAAYAECLTRLGGFDEAWALLSRLEGKIPQTHFSRASALMFQWRYGEAISHLRAFLSAEKDPYRQLVGRTNLAACCLFENQVSRALLLLRGILEETSARKLWRLHANALNLAAQAAIQKRRWAEAEKCLARAEKLASAGARIDVFFVDKWRAVLVGLREGSTSALERVQQEAASRGDWETMRDCDRYLAEIRGDHAAWLRLYFGTPYGSYRDNLARDLGSRAPRLPDRYLLCGGTNAPTQVLDLVDNRVSDGSRLPAVVAQAFSVVASDHYRPTRLLTLFQCVYPGEHYNPSTSPTRVYQLVRRCRRFLREAGIDIRLEEVNGGYRLVCGKTAGILLPREARQDEASRLVGRLRVSFAQGAFSLAQALAALALPRRSLQRQLAELVDEGRLRREGTGKFTRYRVAA